MSKPFRSISVDSKDELKQRILKWILVDDRSVDPNTFYLLDLSNETSLIAAAVEEAFLHERSAISELSLYQGATEAAVSALVDALGKEQLLTRRLGIDLEGVSGHFYRELLQRAPDVEFEDCSGLLAEIRAVKSEDEAHALCHAAQSTDRADWMALDAFQIGWTEAELGVRLRQALIGQGAETISFLILGGGIRGVSAHASPSNAPLARGEIVRLDMGGLFNGWASDLAKTLCVGEASPRQRRVYQTLHSILDDHIARIRPGKKAGDLFNEVASDFNRAELRFGAPHVGHGIGLSVHEWPILTAGNSARIRAGMVLCLELMYVERDVERYHLEELVLVREDEAEVISRSRPAREEVPIIG